MMRCSVPVFGIIRSLYHSKIIHDGREHRKRERTDDDNSNDNQSRPTSKLKLSVMDG